MHPSVPTREKARGPPEVRTDGCRSLLPPRALSPSLHMNGRCSVFGRLKGGDEILNRLERVFTVRRVPVTDIVVTHCSVQEPKA
ncbi:hypothetical protein EON64_16315 [archaeon]|nr:MAG: hypothetical protein EON64_16315 [archaeon]